MRTPHRPVRTRCACPSRSAHRQRWGCVRAHRARATAARRTAPDARHGRAGSPITHPLDHDLIASRNGLCQGETSSTADLDKGGSGAGQGVARARPHLVKGAVGGGRTGAVRDIGCGAPGARECGASSGGAAPGAVAHHRGAHHGGVHRHPAHRSGVHSVEPTGWSPLSGATRCRASPLDAEHRGFHSVDDARHRHHSQALECRTRDRALASRRAAALPIRLCRERGRRDCPTAKRRFPAAWSRRRCLRSSCFFAAFDLTGRGVPRAGEVRLISPRSRR